MRPRLRVPVLLPDSDLSELLDAFNPSCPSTNTSDLDGSVAAINSTEPYITIADSGAKDHNLTTALAQRFAIPGSWRRNTTYRREHGQRAGYPALAVRCETSCALHRRT